MDDDEIEPMYSTKSVAKLFDVKADTVRTWIREGKLHGFQVHGKWRINRSEVMKFAQQRHG